MTTYNSACLGLPLSSTLGVSTGTSLFDHRVVSRPATSTVYVERRTTDPLAARLEESLRQAAELQKKNMQLSIDQQRMKFGTVAPFEPVL